jgi:hypothetical protein
MSPRANLGKKANTNGRFIKINKLLELLIMLFKLKILFYIGIYYLKAKLVFFNKIYFSVDRTDRSEMLLAFY